MTSATDPASPDAPLRRTFVRFLALSLAAGLIGDRLLAAGIELSDGNPLRLDGMLSMFVGLIAGPWWGAVTGLVATARTAWETSESSGSFPYASSPSVMPIRRASSRMTWSEGMRSPRSIREM